MKVHVWDFDGTLVNTPGREEAERLYLAAKGEPWPHKGYYGRPESLAPPVFPDTPDESYAITAVAQICRTAPCDLSVLMTGRPYKLKSRVLGICEALAFKFDHAFFRGQADCYNKGDTFDFKKSVLQDKLLLLPLKELVLWEDREDHHTEFAVLFEELRQVKPEVVFTLHRVLPAGC